MWLDKRKNMTFGVLNYIKLNQFKETTRFNYSWFQPHPPLLWHISHVQHSLGIDNYSPPDQPLLVCESSQVCMQNDSGETTHYRKWSASRLSVTPGVKTSVHYLKPEYTTDWATAG